MIVQSTQFCQGCQRWTLHQKSQEGAGFGCLAFIISFAMGWFVLGPAGAFAASFLMAVILLLYAITQAFHRPLCQFCGRSN